MKDVPGADPPDAALVMWLTRCLNDWAHTHYSFEEVAGMDLMTFDLMGMIQRGMEPPKVEK